MKYYTDSPYPLIKTRPKDAAYDLRYWGQIEEIVLHPHTYGNLITTDLCLTLPENHCGLILSRSGLACRDGIRVSNAPGLIDENYSGELLVYVDNVSDKQFVIKPGDRVAQLLIVPVWQGDTQLGLVDANTDRGSDGFGSSGTA